MLEEKRKPSKPDCLLSLDLAFLSYCKSKGFDPCIAQLLWNRGIVNAEQLDRLLSPKLSDLPHPFVLKDLEKAVHRLIQAMEKKEKIVIYGDYDVDGTCGTALLFDFFQKLGVLVETYQPNRFLEGYGLHSAAVEKFAHEKVDVLVSVDCGITAIEPAKVALQNQIDFIVLDHHEQGAALPDAFAVVDPKRNDDESGLDQLCGTGVAFFLCIGLRQELRKKGFFSRPDIVEPNLADHLDLVAVATIADLVPLLGVNRILVWHGLERLRKKPRPGFEALLKVAGIQKVKSSDCGFLLGPRINAAGRLETAKAALEMLTTIDPVYSLKMAHELDRLNRERQSTQATALELARAQAINKINLYGQMKNASPLMMAGPWPRALVVAPPKGEYWHEGVVGIVASKLVEEFKRPVFVLTYKERDAQILKGSARSFGRIDLMKYLSAPRVCEWLLNYGGHAFAGGVSLKAEHHQGFCAALNEMLLLSTTSEDYQSLKTWDIEVDLENLSGDLISQLERLEPFGMGFPEPIFRVRKANVQNFRILKEKHLRIDFENMGGIWFHAPLEKSAAISENTKWWVTPQWNEWNGSRRIQLHIKGADF